MTKQINLLRHSGSMWRQCLYISLTSSQDDESKVLLRHDGHYIWFETLTRENLYSLFIFSKYARHYLYSAFLEARVTKQDSIRLIPVKMAPYTLSLLYIGPLIRNQKHLSLNKSCLYKRPRWRIKNSASSWRSPWPACMFALHNAVTISGLRSSLAYISSSLFPVSIILFSCLHMNPQCTNQNSLWAGYLRLLP